MNFVVDAHLPMRLPRRLTELGHPSVHIAEWLPRDAADQVVWATAVARRHVVVTKDADYLALAQQRGPSTPLVWLRIGNCSRAELVDFVETRLDLVLAALRLGETVIELR